MTDTSSHIAGDNESAPAAKSHPAFRWRRSSRIASLNIGVEEYEHRATGALHYHLDSESPENVFLVAFRTAPMDSTGVAHILEHTSLWRQREVSGAGSILHDDPAFAEPPS